MPVVFGEMKMSFCVLKKGQLGLSEKAIADRKFGNPVP